MRWLITGASGMLGTDLVAALDGAHEVTAAGRDDLDVTDPHSVDAAVPGYDVVVNCAAWTDVDGAETAESAALRVNADGPRLLAQACRPERAVLVHVSTDYVFAGDAVEPYPEDAALAPRSAYGRTKAAGERAVRDELPEAHLIVRTAWLYGAHGGCFPKTIARLAGERDSLDVVADQVGQPTWTWDVAQVIRELVEHQARGTFHATSSGRATWFDFARDVVAAAGQDPEMVHPTTSSAYPRPAPRPAFSVLGHARLRAAGVDPIGDWQGRWRQAAAAVVR